MEIIKGIGIGDGLAKGKLVPLKKSTGNSHHLSLLEALEQAKSLLDELYQNAKKDVGEDKAEIFSIRKMLLEDEDYLSRLKENEEKGLSPFMAVEEAGDHFFRFFSSLDDEYLSARAFDISELTALLTGILKGEGFSFLTPTEDSILVMEELTAEQVFLLSDPKITGIISEKGNPNAHASILAAARALPLMLLPNALSLNGLFGDAVLDCEEGKLFLSPDQETLDAYKEKKDTREKRKDALQKLKGQADKTKDGVEIRVYANVNHPEEISAVLENDAKGVGLFRSEFLLQNGLLPKEEEQFLLYRSMLEKMDGRLLIIRTMDFGADKCAPFPFPSEEKNPALGLRGIRYSFTFPEVFTTQLRALCRASVYGNLGIMFPMISSKRELSDAKAALEEVKRTLQKEKIPVSEQILTGIMVETPAAALVSETLARDVDFFSIGTNDLTQYTLAVDRENPSLSPFILPDHPAIMRLIRLVAENARNAGIWAGICGELAKDLSLTESLIQMGIREFSLPPSMILPMRERIQNTISVPGKESYVSV